MERAQLLVSDRQKGESYKAVQACNAYLRLAQAIAAQARK